MILNPKYSKIECVLRLKFPCFFLFNVSMHFTTFFEGCDRTYMPETKGSSSNASAKSSLVSVHIV